MAKILLVEDDNNLREIYEARLMAEGYDIVSARDGEEALSVAIKEKPDLVISDVMMPKISGFDMLDILRTTEETKNVKVIMMTALSQAEDKARAEKLGADRYLVKSQVTLEDVAKVAKEVLEGGKTPDGKHPVPGVYGFSEFVSRQSGLSVVTNRTALSNAISDQNTTGVILGLQSAPKDLDERKVSELVDSGIRIIGLEYTNEGVYGGGWLAPSSKLTDKGKGLLGYLDGAGIILDLSHTGHQTADDVLSEIEQKDLDVPVVATHGGVYELFESAGPNNLRNLKERQLQRIVDLGGLVGIYALTFGLSDNDDSPNPFLEHLEYAAARWPKSVAVGTDGVYSKRDLTSWQDHFENFMLPNVSRGTDMEPRFPDIPIELNGPDKVPKIRQALISRGVPEDVANNVTSGNMINYLLHQIY